MKKTKVLLALLLTIGANLVFAQNNITHKISYDLRSTMEHSASSLDMFRIVVLMDEQFDAHTMTKQVKGFNKAQKRAFVIDELQRISKDGQKGLLKDLQDGQKAHLVDDIQSFWIFNGICCSATKEMVYAIAERPDVHYVMEEGYNQIPDGEVIETMLSDRATNQWNVTKVKADDVWNLGYTGQGVIVAIIDTGVNYDHTDIKNNMWDGGDDFPLHGWDFINNDNDPMDDKGHGTHCAGTISSYGTNGKQCGIAKDAKIMALKALDNEGAGSKSQCWAAIQFAVSHHADVLSLSLSSDGSGGDWGDRITMENVLHCGVVAAVAAGNTGNKYENGQLKYPVPYNVGSPGNCPSPWRHPDQTTDGGHSAVVTVGATTSNDIRSDFSSFGPSTWTEGDHIGPYYDYPWAENDPEKTGLIKPDIAAPGSNIVSLSYSSPTAYATSSGTSMATPCVAGVMALILEANPTLTPIEIDSIIETTAVACEGQNVKNNNYGSGRIDALAAITYMLGVCATPTNLTAAVNGFDVDLSWDAAANVSTYRVYRNGTMIAPSVSGTFYTDANAPAGENTYYIRSNGAGNQASLPSNQVTVTVSPTHTPFNLTVSDLNASNQTVGLEWNKLYYTNAGTYYYNFGTEIIAAQRFPVDMLKPYAGMQIAHLFFSLKLSGSNCTIRLYEGNEMEPGTLIHEGNYTTTENYESIDYTFNDPICINPNKTLWITVTTSGALLMDGTYISADGGDAFYYRYPNNIFWDAFPYYAWSFQLGLNDGNNYKYNLYRNGIIVASNINEPNATTAFSNGLNQYQITAYANDYESSFSNSIYVVANAACTNELELRENDYLYGLSGSSLTVSGTLANGNPDHLLLEDGAQLINNSPGVKATVKKNIAACTQDGGWNLIASPLTENLTASNVSGLLANNYDLYTFDQSEELEWRNYEANPKPFSTIDNGTGYLYANSGNPILSFAGTLAASVEPTDLTYDDDTEFSGFNLIGNPYPCNAYVTGRSFYVLQETDNVSEFVVGSNPIPPCSAILVQAQGTGESVTFSKTTPSKNEANISITVSKADTRDRAVVDKAKVAFNPSHRLTKYNLKDNSSRLYIPQNGQDLAVACANGEDALPVNFKTTKDGTYTINFETESLELDYLHLIDNLTGNDVDLLTTPNYTFEAKTTDYASRFSILFAPICEDADGDNDVFAHVNNGEIVLLETCHGASLQIVDMAGRVIVCRDGVHTVSTKGMTQGVYVLRLITADGVKTQKIVIE